MATFRIASRVCSSSRATPSSMLVSSSRSMLSSRPSSSTPPPTPASPASPSSPSPSSPLAPVPSSSHSNLPASHPSRLLEPLPPKFKGAVPRAADSPLPLTDEERKVAEKVDKVWVTDEQLIWITGIAGFLGAGYWIMQQKRKKQLQAGLISEIRERKLYDDGRLDD